VTFLDAVIQAFSEALVGLMAALPTILGALLVLILGWIIAGVFGRLISKALRAIRFNALAARAEIDDFLERTGTELDPAGMLGMLVKWFVRIVFVVAAANTLDMPQVSEFLNQVLGYMPNIAVAVIILVLGAALASFLRDLTRGAVATAGFQQGAVVTVTTVVYWSLLIITVLTALQQLGIATLLSQTLYAAIFGAAGLAFALSFGLGTRVFAADLVAGWALSRQLSAGQQIQVYGYRATIEEIGPTATTLENDKGKMVIPNNQLAQETIVQGS
jgi:hypothetical protein